MNCPICNDCRTFDEGEMCESCAYEAMGGEDLLERWLDTTAGRAWTRWNRVAYWRAVEHLASLKQFPLVTA